jgi:hypothetical protein
MTEAELVQPSAPQPGDAGLSSRGLIEVFYKPEEFFKKLVQSPKVLVPYLAFAAVMLVILFFTKDLVWDAMSTSASFQERMSKSPIPPEQMKVFFGYQFMIGGLIAMMLGPLVMAALALFWGNFVFAGKAGFKQLLSVMLYGEVLFAIGGLVNLPLILAKGNIMANLSLGVLAAGQGMDSVAYAFLSKFSVFYIWEFIAIGIGLAVLYNVKRSRGYTMALLSLGLLSAIGIATTAIGKMF